MRKTRGAPSFGYCNVPACPSPDTSRSEITSTTSTTTTTTTTTTKANTPTQNKLLTLPKTLPVSFTTRATTRPTTRSTIPSTNSYGECGVYTDTCTSCLGKTGIRCDQKLPERKELSKMRKPVSEIEIMQSAGGPIGKVTDTTFNSAKYGLNCARRYRRGGK